MLQPNVTLVIWFLGPLLDGAAGLLIGLGCGLVSAAFPWRRVWQLAVKAVRGRGFLITLTGIAATVIAASYAVAGNVLALRFLKVTLALFLCSFAHRLTRSLPLKTLGVTLGSVGFLLLCGAGAYFLGPSMGANSVSAAASNAMAPPNIILITLDTVRADHLSLYGYSRQTTPNLERWGQQGVVFENAIAPTSWTLASHASMFTGMLPHQHGADWLIPLSTRRWTLAEVLRDWGYETAGFTSNLVYGEAGWGMAEGFEHYEDYRESVPHSLQSLRLCFGLLSPLYRHWVGPETFERRYAFQVNRNILDWLQHRPPGPFFLFINYFDAHDPYLAPLPYAHKFGDYSPDLIRRLKFVFATSHANIPEKDKRALVDAYDTCLRSLDRALGELFNSLSRGPAWEHTVVIITSDHGEGFGEHGAFSHGENLHREAVHVPLIIFGPRIPKGVRVSRLVPTQDLFSTVLAFAGMSVPPVSRTALQRYWTPGLGSADSDDQVVSELSPKYSGRWCWPQITLRTGQWTYILNLGGSEELYRWPGDPGEQVNLAASTEYYSVRAELRARLRSLIGKSLRPWEGPQFLLALDEPGRPFLNVGGSAAEVASSQQVPVPAIGEVQNRFPLKPVVTPRLKETADTDLLQSLPYN
jgi:arylsulfatase A-like enzyme